MKLIDGVKKQGRPFDIPDCSRYGLPEFFKELGFTTGAEIGVLKGQFTEMFCQAGFKMYAIDNWMLDERMFYPRAVKRLSRYPNCTIIKNDSVVAARDFPDNSLDFVYIDADHRFPFVAEDVYYWSQKVKKGGVIAGHDYEDTRSDFNESICSVKPVVNAYVDAFGIENFYTFCRFQPPDGERVDDLVKSFLFFKHW